MTDHLRYGMYLRPDTAMSRAIYEWHGLLAAQYNLQAAGRFMPHATLKGFFRSNAEAATIHAYLDQALANWQPFSVYNNGVARFGPRSIVIDIKYNQDGEPNHALYDLQHLVWSALAPVIHTDCGFSRSDPRGLHGPNPFHPHLTLAMADLRPELQDEVIAFIHAAGAVGPTQFVANTVHLYCFEADWQGTWWKDLTWELIGSWQALQATA